MCAVRTKEVIIAVVCDFRSDKKTKREEKNNAKEKELVGLSLIYWKMLK